MNDTLSALTAFAGFLIGFSMMVQAVQDAIKNWLSLKTGVWERFFVNLYNKEFGLNTDKKVKVDGYIKREFVGDFKSRLLRAREIIVKVDDLLKELKKDLAAIVEVSPSNPYAPQLMFNKVEKLSKSIVDLTGFKINSLLTTFDKFNSNAVATFVQDVEIFKQAFPKSANGVGSFNYKLIVEFQKNCRKLLDGVSMIEEKISNYRMQIENKLDAWLAQLNGEYKRNMLKWTVITGALMVLVTNADSLVIYNYLSANPKIQNEIVLAAQDMEKAFKTKSSDINSLSSLLKTNDLEKIKENIITISGNLEADYNNLGDEEESNKLAKRRDELQKKGFTLSNVKVFGGELVAFYVRLQDKTIKHYSGKVAKMNLPLGGWGEFFNNLTFSDTLQKIFGLLLTIVLVTFGAPFWNNVLTALLGMKNVMKNKKEA